MTALRPLLLAVATFVWTAPGILPAQQSTNVRVTWTPDRPVQGTLFRVHVAAHDEAERVSARMAGEPLHFSRVGAEWQALAAAPLDRGAQLELTVEVSLNGKVDTVRSNIPVAEGSYTIERLNVAPRYGTRPEPAVQARIDRERERALAVSRAAHSTPRMWDKVLIPRPTRITSMFGSGREFNGQIQSRHTGTDLAGGVGAPVRAAARGVVALVDRFYLAGRVIYIDHGEGLVTAYFHLSRQDVGVGDTVEAGQQIGLVGTTGRVTGPHLHWVVRYGAISVDPLSLIAITKP